jgi:hypothetical protein
MSISPASNPCPAANANADDDISEASGGGGGIPSSEDKKTGWYCSFWLAVRVLWVTYKDGTAVLGMVAVVVDAASSSSSSPPKLAFFFRLLLVRVRMSELVGTSVGMSITGLESSCAGWVGLDGVPCLSALVGGVASGKAYGSWVSGSVLLGTTSCSRLSCATLRFP